MIHFLKNTPVQTCLSLFLAAILSYFMNGEAQNVCYTLSCVLKDVLLFILPPAVFFFIAFSLRSFEKQGFALLILLILFEAFSNTLASGAAYGLSFIAEYYVQDVLFATKGSSLNSYFSLADLRPSFWRVEYGTGLGAVVGITGPYLRSLFIDSFLIKGKKLFTFIFSKVFARLIPLFIFGFFLNLMQGGVLGSIFTQSAQALLLMTGGLLFYIFILFFGAAGSFVQSIKMIANALPAGMTAFSTMSSAATMPITIEVTEKNLKNKAFASMLIPATTNIQQIGDCFCNVFLCCMILIFYGKGLPDPTTFATFLSVFVVARFTTAGMIGGAIFIMLPIYQSYLGFDAEMTALILSLNMLLDPLVTSTNVMANSALCVLFEKVWGFYHALRTPSSIVT